MKIATQSADNFKKLSDLSDLILSLVTNALFLCSFLYIQNGGESTGDELTWYYITTSLNGEEQFDTCWQLLTQPLLWGTWDLLQQTREWGGLTQQNWSLVRVSAFQIRLVEFYTRTVSDLDSTI